MPTETLAFFLLAGLILASAIGALALRNLVHGVLCLVLTFAGLAALYLQLGAQFVGFVQILVYVGAVAILIVFAILLTRSDEQAAGTPRVSAAAWLGLIVGAAVFGSLALALRTSAVRALPRQASAVVAPARPATGEGPSASVKAIGLRLLAQPEHYVVPLEVAGLLLTAAMIGAAVIAMPEGKKR